MDLQGLKNNIARRVVRLTDLFSQRVEEDTVTVQKTELTFSKAQDIAKDSIMALSVDPAFYAPAEGKEMPAFDQGAINQCFKIEDPTDPTKAKAYGGVSFGCTPQEVPVNIHTVRIDDFRSIDKMLEACHGEKNIAIVIEKMTIKGPNSERVDYANSEANKIRNLETDFSLYFLWSTTEDKKYRDKVYKEIGLDQLALQIESINDKNIFAERSLVSRRGFVNFVGLGTTMQAPKYFVIGFRYKYNEELTIEETTKADSSLLRRNGEEDLNLNIETE